MNIFNIDGWHGLLLVFPDNYYQLRKYIDHPEARKTYLNSITEVRIDLKSKKFETIKFSEYNNEEEKKVYLDNVERAFYQLANQMIVIYSSFLESIIQEFFEVFFYYKPTSMHHFLSKEYDVVKLGNVDLNTILNSKDLDDLKMKLAIRAANNANKGSIDNILKRIEKLIKINFGVELKSRLSDLNNHRNRIVHENYSYNIDNDTVDNISKILLELILVLGKYFKENSIPVKDDGGIIS